MGLFKKVEKFMAPCPHCGTEHEMEYTADTKFYLNGFPKTPVANLMKTVALCTKCGLVYLAQNTYSDTALVLNNPDYQAAAAQEYVSDIEQKLHLLYSLNIYQWVPAYFSAYYHETNQEAKMREWLTKEAENVLTGQDTMYQNVTECNARGACSMPAFKRFEGQFILSPELRLVDIYRRLGKFEDALDVIQRLRAKKYGKTPYTLFEYLDVQEHLIAQKDITWL